MIMAESPGYIFVSHASQDRRIAKTLCATLESRGLTCWIAMRDIVPGDSFQEAIVRAIRKSRIMLLLFTMSANNSDEVKKELALAGQNNLVIIPLRVEEVIPDDAFAFELATRQWIDLFEDWERGVGQLTTHIAALYPQDDERSRRLSDAARLAFLGDVPGASLLDEQPAAVTVEQTREARQQILSPGSAAPASWARSQTTGKEGRQAYGSGPAAEARLGGSQSAGTPARSGAAALGAPVPTQPLGRPRIIVLPFQNMSGDPEQDYFVDGMVEEIITALSRIPWLFVIARNSSFTYKGKAVDVRQVGRELGVRYVLEGSVRKAGNRVRITGQLIDAISGTHVWADRFDGSLEDVFEFQDRVAASVAGIIEPALQAAETARTVGHPTDDLTAYDLYLRAYAMYLSSSRQIPEALRLMEQAIDRDPHYGPALAWAAICCCRLLLDDHSADREADRLKGAGFARRALEVAGDDPGVIANVAQALGYLGEDIDAMMALADRALALNPNYARGWYISGNLRVYAGHLDVAIKHLDVCRRLSPLARTGPLFATIGAAYFFGRQFDVAEPKLRLSIQEDPYFPSAFRVLAACYAHMDRPDEAREIFQRLCAIAPPIAPRFDHLRNADHRELLRSGLRLAAGEAI
jgi:TolB-like protein